MKRYIISCVSVLVIYCAAQGTLDEAEQQFNKCQTACAVARPKGVDGIDLSNEVVDNITDCYNQCNIDYRGIEDEPTQDEE